MTWTAKPDAYFAGLKKVQSLIDQGVLTGPAVPYVTNSLTIMVPAGNPGHVNGLPDLRGPTFVWPCRIPSSKVSPGKSRRP